MRVCTCNVPGRIVISTFLQFWIMWQVPSAGLDSFLSLRLFSTILYRFKDEHDSGKDRLHRGRGNLLFCKSQRNLVAIYDDIIRDVRLFQMARTQKNKATSGHLGLLKAKLAKLRRELITPKGGGGGGEQGFEVAKTGDARIGFVGAFLIIMSIFYNNCIIILCQSDRESLSIFHYNLITSWRIWQKFIDYTYDNILCFILWFYIILMILYWG